MNSDQRFLVLPKFIEAFQPFETFDLDLVRENFSLADFNHINDYIKNYGKSTG